VRAQGPELMDRHAGRDLQLAAITEGADHGQNPSSQALTSAS
jgi:hypothetical protein